LLSFEVKCIIPKLLHSLHLTCDNVHVSIQKMLLFVEWNDWSFYAIFYYNIYLIYSTFFSCHIIEIQVSVLCAQGTYFDIVSGCKMSCAPRSTLTTIDNT